MTNEHQVAQHSHSHMWVVGALGIVAGLAFMIFVPSLPAVSQSLMLFALFHVLGGVIVLGSAYSTASPAALRKLHFGPAGKSRYDFGWAPAWINGPWILALVELSAAIAIQVTVPALWPLSLALTLLAAIAFAGYLIARMSAREDHAALPMVALLRNEDDLVLDAGCGAGRTTVAFGRANGKARIVSFDRFDSDYIAGGGRGLLESNVALAGLTGRVKAERGDITAMPFADKTFDSLVSAHAIDHLGAATPKGLSELFRVLKPGGRFLLIVWVPGWTMFAIANVMSFFLAPKSFWRRETQAAGFKIVEDGTFNGMWHLVLERPAT